MHQTINFDLDLIRRHDKAGPRYTSYPTAVQFHEGFTEHTYEEHARASNTLPLKPLSLYLHIPFCDTLCFYCACNKIATKDRSLTIPYLQHLHQEIALQAALFQPERPVTQLHWGGGTPTFLSPDQMQTLMNVIREHFQLLTDDTGEYSIEIDPREATPDTIALLRELGFNRISLGVQDFDPKVQTAVNRLQSEEETLIVLEAARQQGFQSISIDLIYGLPHQTPDSFQRTLEKIITWQPNRLSVFNYAHLPILFKPQRRINETDLPGPTEKLAILQNTIHFLTSAGYLYIGMDHFALPNDELARAQRNGTLYRNFQGYATQSHCDLIGLGTTSIGKVGNSYSQNVKTLEDYYNRIDQKRLPVFRGITLTADDLLRRAAIMQLICHFQLNIPQFEQQHSIHFNTYFSQEYQELRTFQDEGLLTITDSEIIILPVGRLLVRNICMIFDNYLRQAQTQRFSKVI